MPTQKSQTKVWLFFCIRQMLWLTFAVLISAAAPDETSVHKKVEFYFHFGHGGFTRIDYFINRKDAEAVSRLSFP